MSREPVGISQFELLPREKFPGGEPNERKILEETDESMK